MTTIFTTYTKIVGVTGRNENGDEIQEILNIMASEWESSMAILHFFREPNNEYDCNAIAVYAACVDDCPHIGYLSRELAAELAPKIDAGCRLTGRISEITGGAEKKRGCNIRVELVEYTAEELRRQKQREEQIAAEIKQKQKAYTLELERKTEQERLTALERSRKKNFKLCVGFGLFFLIGTFVNPVFAIPAIALAVLAFKYKK